MTDVPNTCSYMVIGFAVIVVGTILYMITLIHRCKKVLQRISAFTQELEKQNSIEDE